MPRNGSTQKITMLVIYFCDKNNSKHGSSEFFFTVLQKQYFSAKIVASWAVIIL